MVDIIIPLKRSMINEELRYTLRSICENVPHNKVWLSGYRIDWASHELGAVEVSVPMGSKYMKTANNILRACKDDRVADDFLLFNDDFFVMKPMNDFKNMHRGKLIDHITRLENEGIVKAYYQGMKRTYEILQEMGFKEPLNYSLHIPMIMNKQKWLEMWRELLKINLERKPVHLRTFYGNYFKVGGRKMDDVKIANFEDEPTGKEAFLSSNDHSFVQGKMGEYVRERFPERCKYES